MSLFLLLDEDSQSKYLANLLKRSGHDVLTVNEAGITGFSDAMVFDYCRQSNRILLTRNCDDFQVLHQVNPIHPGIIAIYQDADPDKNMTYQAIAHAINNLESVGFNLANQFVILNQWQF